MATGLAILSSARGLPLRRVAWPVSRLCREVPAMPRLTPKRYEQQLSLTMMVYVVVMLADGPLLHAASHLALKAALAVAPVLPMLYVIALMWRRVRDSDELEQRTHLVALGAAAALVCGLSMVGGFLVAGGVLHIGGAVLIGVFPVLMVSYALARKLVARRYGMDASCTGEGSAWLPWYFVSTGALMAAVALYAWWRRDLRGAEIFAAAAILFAAMAAWARWRRIRARRRPGEG